MARVLSEQEQFRREALTELRALGINPFPAAEYPVTHTSKQILASFKDGEDFGEVCLAGRIMTKRIMGKASFAVLADPAGKVQIYVNRDVLCPSDDKTWYNTVFKRLLDIGDFIGVIGRAHV